jgi:hypothetical protein
MRKQKPIPDKAERLRLRRQRNPVREARRQAHLSRMRFAPRLMYSYPVYADGRNGDRVYMGHKPRHSKPTGVWS